MNNKRDIKLTDLLRSDQFKYYDCDYNLACIKVAVVQLSGQAVLTVLADGRMVPIGQLNTATNVLNITDEDSIRWAGKQSNHSIFFVVCDLCIYYYNSGLSSIYTQSAQSVVDGLMSLLRVSFLQRRHHYYKPVNVNKYSKT